MRGLDRHLARLEAASGELFGAPVGEARLRDLIRGALGDRAGAFVRVSLFARQITHRATTWIGAPSVMVGVFDPPPPLSGGLRVQPQTYLREAPHLKHVATFGLIRARRAAALAGFDDAVFMDGEGRFLEGTLWNLGFVHGDHVVWPEGPKLEGVARALIADHLTAVGMTQEERPVRLVDLADFDHAFLCNSATPAAAIAAIGDHAFAASAQATARLAQAWSAASPQKI